MTLDEAAAEVGISKQYIWRMVKMGKIKAKRHGVMWDVSKASLARFKREREERITAVRGLVLEGWDGH